MTSTRNDPDSPANAEATRQNEREAFALQQQAKARCLRCKQPIAADYLNPRGLCEDCEFEGQCEEYADLHDPVTDVED